MTLGGGVEACMPADQIIFSAETYYGLVETGVGLIPAGGGCKELALLASQQVEDPEVDLQPWINAVFETVAMAKVSTSGHDTKRLGFMRAARFRRCESRIIGFMKRSKPCLDGCSRIYAASR